MDHFIEEFTIMQRVIYKNAKEKGFWDQEVIPDGEKIALIHSELSEALEAIRDGNMPSRKIPHFSCLEEELADAVIRIMDYAEGKEVRLAEAILAKMAHNIVRPYKHGKVF